MIVPFTYAETLDTAKTEHPVIPETIEGKISFYAEKYEVSSTTMYAVIKCESSLNPNAVGDGGTSFGLAQIHLPAHPNITKEEAFDSDFAIEFMAREMKAGNSWKWTCWKKLYRR